ncbi:MAG: 23S rRNA (guanosine(2251)-2'-O)-methyltransferase RlmB, partial [Gammaproteobacteria bacterium]|nr:23S rRNA (guanosine(2251)-2'-O)-methyltransferase RlmB [Gammaproteobacteria bacterium]
MSSSIVFGIYAVTAVLDSSPDTIQEVLLQDNYRKNKKLLALSERLQKKRIRPQIESKQTLDRLCEGGNHQGVVVKIQKADKRMGENELLDYLERIPGKRFVLILDQIQDPHNLGACLRTAAAAGVNAVIAPKDAAVSITPVVRKTACGATERVPYVQVTNLSRTMAQLRDMGIWITGTDVTVGKTPYDIDFKDDIAIVIGSEGKGLRRLVKENCDFLVKIPMPGEFESLNASVATGV